MSFARLSRRMKKIALYVTLSVLTITILTAIGGLFQIKSNLEWVEKFVPSFLENKLFSSLLTHSSNDSEAATFVLGTSHVVVGFDPCATPEIKTYYGAPRQWHQFFALSRAIMVGATKLDLKGASIVMELSLFDKTSKIKQKGFLHSSLFDKQNFSLFTSTLNHGLFKRRTVCNDYSTSKFQEMALQKSIATLEQVDPVSLHPMLEEYKENLTRLIQTCEQSSIRNITLVSLPIHPILYNRKEVQQTFHAIENSLSVFLDDQKAKHSCDIKYLNLTSMGNDYSDVKYWRDAGHFLPEVGVDILKRIESAYFKRSDMH